MIAAAPAKAVGEFESVAYDGLPRGWPETSENKASNG
jgi:hypothetical protein